MSGGSSTARFRDLAPQEKAEVRRQERDAKRERERTLGYFRSALEALNTAATTCDASTVAAVVDGLMTELLKQLRKDEELFLLRNGTVCRAVESAMRLNRQLLHAKTLTYFLLGKLPQVALSPTSSFLLEALLESLCRNVSLPQTESLHDLGTTSTIPSQRRDLELMEGGEGIDCGSGLPNVGTLMLHVVQEISEALDELLLSSAGSRVLRSLLALLRGATCQTMQQQQRQRSAAEIEDSSVNQSQTATTSAALASSATPHHPHALPRFESLLLLLVREMSQSIERVFAPKDSGEEASHVPGKRSTTTRGNAWAAACTTLPASTVVQAMLQCCVPDDFPHVDAAIRQRMQQMTTRQAGTKTPHHLLLSTIASDPTGVFVVQTFLKCPPSRAVREASQNFAAEQKRLLLSRKEPGPVQLLRSKRSSADAFVSSLHKKAAVSVSKQDAADDSSHSAASCWWRDARRDADDIFSTPWDAALAAVAFDEETDRCIIPAELVPKSPMWYLMQDFALYVPTAHHAASFWCEVLEPQLVQGQYLLEWMPVLVRFVRRLASCSNNNNDRPGSENGGLISFAPPAGLVGAVVKAVTDSVRVHSGSSKAFLVAVLVQCVLGEALGCELVQHLLSCPLDEISHLMHAFDKLNLEDLRRTALHPQGSHILQQFLLNAARAPTPTPSCSVSAPSQRHQPTGGTSKNAKVAPTSSSPSPSSPSSCPVMLRRMAIRLFPVVAELVRHKHGCHVVEVLHDVLPLELRESLLKLVVPLYQAEKARRTAASRKRPRTEGDDTSKAESAGDNNVIAEEGIEEDPGAFYFDKVMTRLKVETYLYRPDEWRQDVARTLHVQRMMQRILELESTAQQAS